MKTIFRFPLVALLFVALVACGSNKSSGNNSTSGADNASGAAASAAPAENGGAAPMEAASGAPDCGSDQTVWVNLKTHVYHEQNSPLYGKTKHGQYMCLSQAKADGFHSAGAGARHHHRRSESSDSTNSM